MSCWNKTIYTRKNKTSYKLNLIIVFIREVQQLYEKSYSFSIKILEVHFSKPGNKYTFKIQILKAIGSEVM